MKRLISASAILLVAITAYARYTATWESIDSVFAVKVTDGWGGSISYCDDIT
jgi:hypothetical protein